MDQHPTSRASAITRRSLLAGTAATALGGLGVDRAQASPAQATPVEATPVPAAGPTTVRSLTARRPFYIAHRGGGRDWPQLTAYAYEQATKLPTLQALEVSVCISDDGVLVCNHDRFTTASTGVPYRIIEQTWETLSQLRVLPRGTLDPHQPPRPFTRFDDVVERYLDDYVLFVEPKVPSADEALMRTMVRLGQPERVVWKQPVNSRRFRVAKQHGFSTWGYVLDEPAHTGHNLERYAASPDVDMLGAWVARPDAFVSRVVSAGRANDKLTIAWEIASVADRDRALRLGCTGMMTSDVLNVVDAPL